MASIAMSRVDVRYRPRLMAEWLFCVAALVFSMVLIGGITRLTESGLSITEWNPVTGAIPPLSEGQWQEAFNAYKRIPEFAAFNSSMTLAGFKSIYFWEYLHRLVARIVGIAFAMPFIWFAFVRAIPPGYAPRLAALLALGGLQGAVGWWMVASGLTLRTDVSHIRLAVHLGMALFIFGGLLWTALDLQTGGPNARLTRPALGAFIVLAVQVVLGAFTAGLDAGYAYSSWPLMGNRLFPEGGWRPDWSVIANAVDNPIVVQFVHRWWAFAVVLTVTLLGRRARAAGDRTGSVLIHLAVGTQILLGIATLLSGVNIVLAICHQATGALLVAAVVRSAHRIGKA